VSSHSARPHRSPSRRPASPRAGSGSARAGSGSARTGAGGVRGARPQGGGSAKPRVPARVPGATLPKPLALELRRAARPKHVDEALNAFERFLAAQAKGNVAEARRQLARAKDAAPRSANVRESLGKLAFANEEWHEAAQELLAHRRLTGEQRNAPAIAECYLRLGRAVRALEFIAEIDPAQAGPKAWAEIRAMRARTLAATGRAGDAADFLAYEIQRERDPRIKARLEKARAELQGSVTPEHE
jgi:hypothetical protein